MNSERSSPGEVRQGAATDRASTAADPQGLFAGALAHHRAGRLVEAEQLYWQILAVDPRHAHSLHLLGVIAHQRGHHQPSIDLIRRAIQLQEDAAVFHSNLGLVLKSVDKTEEAIAHYQRALTLRPDFADAHNNLGSALFDQGKLDAAQVYYERALALNPNYAAAHINLGCVFNKRGRREEALSHYRRGLALDPRSAEGYNNLGEALHQQGKLDDAMASYERALDLKPDFAEAHVNLGNVLKDQGRVEAAIASYERALAFRPDFAEAHNNLGNALRDQGRLDNAVMRYQRAIALKPDFADAYNHLGGVYLDQGKLNEAMAQCQRAAALQPDNAEIYANLSLIYFYQGKLERALAQTDRALALRPDKAEAYFTRSLILRALGRVAEARCAGEKAIELAPRVGRYYRHLVNVGALDADDPHLAAMESLANDASLPTGDKVELHFAIGKAYADLGRPESAFPHLREANALKRRQIVYDEPETLDLFKRIAAVFTAQLLHSKSGYGSPSTVPVFIVGMPRSGTTLVEQILASHPKVFGGGELNEFRSAVKNLNAAVGTSVAYPEIAQLLSSEQLYRLGTAYMEAVRAFAAEAERITDKLPQNFLFLGLIHLALPHARIIHLRRNPIDTCLSCFSILFAGEHPYAYDLGELGRYYRGYQALMQHWREVLPEGVMLEVQYEEVVANLEQEARRIIAYCGLDWDDACLAFHKTERPVLTASAVQVRQPIYHNSVGRWQPYKDFLQPLTSELDSDR